MQKPVWKYFPLCKFRELGCYCRWAI
ncbi:hypothetical protein XAC3810_660177 [Xanthomonas citri pv. citri]|uniref:Uncharacterized protein n=1 Tax=Xanthomonas citri pv. citri TaxID=611301 RepID=A0A0U5FIK7_XANCI|nr:hypothetical protein XAC9322_630150 [Xanthomonas citri pv. citri]CEE36576.1 hypothetical protein XAC3824_820200 [Xanthomonas citri pv. citri]CEE37597.1 hypothetical protein XAC1083_650177 [Xanthomonas citri pv. citri]CEE46120.1 hypothetical protein XAC3810_660177 [Xanthomonas citri pv. citri]CEE47187.1 hypothetical protein XAC902_970178 [Xanthomonas citri pv. citri]